MITHQRTIVLNLERPIQICAEVAREGAGDPNPAVELTAAGRTVKTVLPASLVHKTGKLR